MFNLGSESAPSEPPQVRKQIDRLVRKGVRSAWREIAQLTDEERDEVLKTLRETQSPLKVMSLAD